MNRVVTRRAFVVGGLATMAAPLAADAQQARRPARIGVLCLVPCQGRAMSLLLRADQLID